MCFNGPNAQRHPQLAVVTQRAAVDGAIVREHTRQPLFDRGFAVASRDADRPGLCEPPGELDLRDHGNGRRCVDDARHL